MGIVGTGIAGVITDFTIFFVNILYTSLLDDIREAVFWPDSTCFQGIWEYMEIGLPAAIMLSLDGLSWHLFIVISGFLSVVDQAA